jgi:hypothetical protein
MGAMRIRISAVRRLGLLRRCVLRRHHAASLRLDPAPDLISGPAFPEGRAMVPGMRRVSVRAIAEGKSSFPVRPFWRIGMIAAALRSRVAV